MYVLRDCKNILTNTKDIHNNLTKPSVNRIFFPSKIIYSLKFLVMFFVYFNGFAMELSSSVNLYLFFKLIGFCIKLDFKS